MNKRKIGREKEMIATDFLIKEGYQVIERNFFSTKGEIDIIAKENEYLVFIEVKYRKNTTYGYPEESVNISKMKKIVSTAKYYMYKHNISYDTPCRFDVIIMLGSEISVIKNAFFEL